MSTGRDVWRSLRDLEEWSWAVDAAMRSGDSEAVDSALDFLDLDPYYFRSGYQRSRLTRRLASSTLDAHQRVAARRHVLLVVDGGRHGDVDAVGRLARNVADNGLRRALRERLLRSDPQPALLSLRVLRRVRHPGLGSDGRTRAQELVLDAASGCPWLSRDLDRLSRWLWEPTWGDELLQLLDEHGPRRSGATLILRARTGRPGP